MDSGLRCALQIIFLDSSLGFVQASQGLSLCSFGGSSTPEIKYALSCYHAGRQNIDPNRLLLYIAWGCLTKSSRSLLFSWFLWPSQDSQFQTHWNIHTALHSHISIFYSGDRFLWVEHLSLLTPNIGNIYLAKELYFYLIWLKDMLPVYIVVLQVVLQPSVLEVFLLQKRSFSWSATSQSNLVRASRVRLHWDINLRLD